MAERPEDLNLPNSVITRIVKEALPDGVVVSKDARQAIAKAASVFVLYATSCANNFAMKGKRKTIAGSDVISAMEEMEYENFVSQLKDCLETFRKEQKGKKDAAEQRKKAKDKEATEEKEETAAEEGGEAEQDGDIQEQEVESMEETS